MNRFNFTVQTDKMPGGWHGSYMPVYDKLFDSIRYTSKYVIEIGVDGGGSLLMWRDYFNSSIPPGKDGTIIVGVDIFKEPDSLNGQQNIVHYQHDAYAEGVLEKPAFKGIQFDALIDDGPHTLETQQSFVQNYVPMLTQEGIAVVEDVQDMEWIPRLHAKLPEGFMGYGVDLRWMDDRYDSILFVCHRK